MGATWLDVVDAMGRDGLQRDDWVRSDPPFTAAPLHLHSTPATTQSHFSTSPPVTVCSHQITLEVNVSAAHRPSSSLSASPVSGKQLYVDLVGRASPTCMAYLYVDGCGGLGWGGVGRSESVLCSECTLGVKRATCESGESGGVGLGCVAGWVGLRG